MALNESDIKNMPFFTFYFMQKFRKLKFLTRKKVETNSGHQLFRHCWVRWCPTSGMKVEERKLRWTRREGAIS